MTSSIEVAGGAGGSRSLGPNYTKLWLASGISNLGDGVRLTALPLLAAHLTREPALIAGVEFATTLPWFLFALLAGAMVDRVDRRKAMVAANVARAVIVGGLAALVAAGAEHIALLYAVGFLMGCAETVFDNAAQAMMPALVHKDHLEKANGRLYAVEIVTNQFAGPPLGAFLFVAAAAVPFFFDAATFAVAAFLIALFSGSFRSVSEGPPTTIRGDIAEGLRWLWAHRLIRTLAIALGIWNAVSIGAFAVFVLFALQVLELSELGFGFLTSTFVIGSLIGSFIAPRLSKLAPGPTLIGQVLLGALTMAAMAATSNAIVVAVAAAVSGIATVVWNVITVSLRQRIIPNRLLGRVNSVYRMLGWGSMPIGAAIGGFLAEVWGLRAPFWFAAGALFLMAIAMLPVVNTRTIQNAKSAAETEPSGPRTV